MDLLFDFLQHDMAVLFAVTAISLAIAIAALWALAANLRKK